MSNNFNEQDPLYQTGKRQQEIQTDKTFQTIQQWGAMERAIQKRLAGFLLTGIPRLLWKYSRTALWGFILPWWAYVLLMIGVGFGMVGTTYDISGFLVALLFFAGIPFAGMIASMIHAYRRAIGVSKLAVTIQIPTASLFVIVATYRALNTPFGHPPFEPESMECGIAVFLMVVFFLVTVLADAARAFIQKRSME